MNNRIFPFWMTPRYVAGSPPHLYMARRYYYFAEKHYRMLFKKNINGRKCISAYKYSPKYKQLSNMRNQNKYIECIA